MVRARVASNARHLSLTLFAALGACCARDRCGPVAATTLPAVEPIARSSAPTAPAEAAEAAEGVVAATATARDPARALAQRVNASPSRFAALPAEAWLALRLPGLRVYDLRAAIEDGGDRLAPLAEPLGGAEGTDGAHFEAPDDDVDPRVVRIADAVRAEASRGREPSDDEFVLPTTFGLVVSLPSHDVDEARFLALEGVLERLATVGGPRARVSVARVASRDEAARALGGDAGTTDAAAFAALLAGARPLGVPAATGRVLFAARVRRAAYVSDFSMEAPGPLVAEPVVSHVDAGFAASARLEEDGIRVEARFVRVREPIKEFETSLASGPVVGHAVRIALPEVSVLTGDVVLPARVGATRLRPLADGSAFLVRVDAYRPSTPRARGWTRAGATPSPAPSGLRATRLVEAHLTREHADGRPIGVAASPRLLALEGQRASVTLSSRTAYLSNFEVRRVGESATADPVISTLSTGTTLLVRVVREVAGGAAIEGEVRLADVETPLAEWATSLGSGAPVRISVPAVWTNVAPFRVVLADGEERELAFAVRTAGGDETLRLRLKQRPATPAEPAPAAPR